MTREIDDVAESLQKAQGRTRKCALLIGAGCSAKAGIPTAQGFVEIIKNEYPCAYSNASEKTYPQCMAQLAPGERRDLIARYVDSAKINWAHLGIAQLVEHGFIDRVLTTNFDPLVVRAYALLGIFPAVYDFAASQLFKPAQIAGQAVFYLHGQRTGFVLLNTKEECDDLSQQLSPVFEDATDGRVWLVVGYSGENDPVFDHLAKAPPFDYRLYWVGYRDNEPPAHVRQQLLVDGKYAYYVPGHDADDFFVTLTQRLGCFPPDFVVRPFSHLNGLLESLTTYSIPQQSGDLDVMMDARKLIGDAISQFEGPVPENLPDDASPTALSAWSLLMAGKYDKLVALLGDKTMAPELAEPRSWAYFMQAAPSVEQAEQETGQEADRLFRQAYENYEAALKIKPQMNEALNNWAVALFEQAKQKTGEEADRLLGQACEKCEAALKIKPDKYGALNNWGNALLLQAKQRTGEEADRLFGQACEKYNGALKIKPDVHDALNNWGAALFEQAKRKTGEEAGRLFGQACEKYGAALKIKPDYHSALANWGAALLEQARRKTGEEADRLFGQAYEKYEAALKIKPDNHETLNNWGIALLEQARRKTGEEADHLRRQARDRVLASESISTGFGAYNMACICALLGDEAQCREWLLKSRAYGRLPSRRHLAADPDLLALRECEWFKQLLADLKEPEE